MSYAALQSRLDTGGIVILDGGTGTELERRGVPMDHEAWCGPANLAHLDVLEAVHGDFIQAGADIITVNTFASSRLMLSRAGYGGQVAEINRNAVASALKARDQSGPAEVWVAGSLSHMLPRIDGGRERQADFAPSEIADAFGELAELHRRGGCDLILLEMMYHPDRMVAAFDAAKATGLPVWAGFSARRGDAGQVLSFAPEIDIPFGEIVAILADYEIQVAGVMHSAAEVTGDALAILRQAFAGPLSAYPDSGYFEMPHWQFQDIMAPQMLLEHARDWLAGGVQVVGGCCGLSPEHIAAVASLKR